ncbi:MAG: TPM domain-containing protein [Bacteroidota bacterium]
MKSYSLLLLCVLFCLSAPAQKKKDVFYKPAPKQFIPVNDFAGLLTPAQVSLLSQKIQQYRDTSGHVIVVITHKNLTDVVTGEEYSIEAAALHYFNKWKIGDKDKNDGVLIFVAKQERKVRIATGKGIDDILTDDICQSIIDNDIVPNFKQQRYYEGISGAVQRITENISPSASFQVQVPEKESMTLNQSNPVNKSDIGDYMSKGFGVLVIGAGLWAFFADARRRRMRRTAFTIDNSGSNIYPGYGNTYVNNNIYPRRNWFWGNGGHYYHDHHHHGHHHSGGNYSGSSSYGSSDSSSGGSSGSSSSGSSGGSSYGGGSSSGGGASGSW